jgi:NAD(P)-dependent dehydrogenase (short-subunit alcohol dehydrogenase family)
MDLELTGKIAVVTGASRGIGLAIAQRLAAEGVQVVGGARSPGPDLEAVAETVAVDLGTPDGPERLVGHAIERFGGVDVLVNNVAGAELRADPAAVTDAEWQRTFELNFLSAVRAVRAALPAMVERGGGSIVSIASVNSYLPDPAGIDYSATKAALVSYSKSISLAYATKGIRANVVSPGLTATDMWLGSGGIADMVAGLTGGTREQAIAGAEGEVPTGRFLDPDEVARIVAVLASGAASGMTGTEVVVDAGITPTA